MSLERFGGNFPRREHCRWTPPNGLPVKHEKRGLRRAIDELEASVTRFGESGVDAHHSPVRGAPDESDLAFVRERPKKCGAGRWVGVD